MRLATDPQRVLDYKAGVTPDTFCEASGRLSRMTTFHGLGLARNVCLHKKTCFLAPDGLLLTNLEYSPIAPKFGPKSHHPMSSLHGCGYASGLFFILFFAL